ncbi:alanine racemase [Mechercharimyces sp. CAU 1602]|uniref:alanine racemase n=1 Tax=Mechercharimyces sp. CAU 1602 TaxID=2973933 RepID=UPI002162C329|nr:alanine racemase [Mechercharimyces sp. CAU 1602]
MAEIDLDAICHNVKQFRCHLPSGTQLMAVVKADGYGHGAQPVAQAAVEAGVDWLGVAFLDEALELRRGGIKVPLLVMGYTPPVAAAIAAQEDITLMINSSEDAIAMAHVLTDLERPLSVHVKVDTGMGRMGVLVDETVAIMEKLSSLNKIKVSGLFTHFACSDEKDKTYTHEQAARFQRVIDQLQAERLLPPIVHAANSGAAIDLPQYAYSMVRIGISLYGYYPSPEVDRSRIALRPALTLKTKVVRVKRLPKSYGVSYGKTTTVNGKQWIATLPIGYADGFSRQLSNRGVALIGGKRVPIVGRVCMDQMMIDVSSVMPVKVGDEVVLYGNQRASSISVDEVADMLNTISYEVTSKISRRVPRIYIKEGQETQVINYLHATSGDLF